ncbi:hypothetical protein COLO4_02809 [Corchorus olitorius]|uniref:Uncharacterized protein n=1 Tax=Corchorus olitorius TaxID=93759 RepID=A0A1R3L086_9ROSI|nr:hypothetical protein COLO4_02809 [Corchorus olitorius]
MGHRVSIKPQVNPNFSTLFFLISAPPPYFRPTSTDHHKPPSSEL